LVEPFMMTYGDGVADIDVGRLLAFHRSHGKLATLTAVRPPARFGALELDGDRVTRFAEKPQSGEGWVNGGFFVFDPKVIDYIAGDETHLEREPLEALARDGQLMVYKHVGFWQSMDTLRDVRLLNAMWDSGDAPWKSWTE
jgi:glucose-1-phosphate cytidylyltransferase